MILNQNRFVKPEDFTAREILRQNVKALLKLRGGPNNPTALGKRAGVGQSGVLRILNKQNPTIETVEKVAKVYGLQAWQLLVAGMEPSNPPALIPISKAERALYEGLKAALRDAGKGDTP